MKAAAARMTTVPETDFFFSLHGKLLFFRENTAGQ